MGGGAREVVTKNENLQTMVTLDDSRVDQLIQCAWKETFEKGTKIIEEGDLLADYFYIVQSGSFEVFVSDEEGGANADKARHSQTFDAASSKLVSMQESVMNEKNIFMMTNSPFIIALYECFNSAQTLYFLMEAALGGELY